MPEADLDPRLLEQRLGQIRGVISARVVERDDGEIGEIHIMATSQRTAKQLVRDIESLILLHFGRKVDYRKISIVQLEGRRVASLNRVRLKSVENEIAAESQRWSVILEYDRKDLIGRWEGVTSVLEAEGAALATLGAVQELMGGNLALTLKEARVTQIEGGPVVIAAVILGLPPRQETLLGSSFVKDRVAEASARAVLSALNRRLPFTVE
ncbi:MAG: hypothetical protein Q8P59_00130 [Dehalococcoidia bacterium]|nr:hypothetical protein [Dehalococcoidia bacterium]